jgi:hypothetical protein
VDAVPLAAVFVGPSPPALPSRAKSLPGHRAHPSAALLPWFFPPVLWRFDLPASVRDTTVARVARWGNFVTPPIYAVRDPPGSARAAPADVRLVVAAVALGSAPTSSPGRRPVAVELRVGGAAGDEDDPAVGPAADPAAVPRSATSTPESRSAAQHQTAGSAK